MSEEHNINKIKRLGNDNYQTWAYEISALLRSKSLWDVVDGTRTVPAPGDAAGLVQYSKDHTQALGFLQMSLEVDQRPHIHGLNTPASVWTTLRDIHNQKTSSTRFVAYNAVFNVAKKEDESLQALGTRVTGLMQKVKDLHFLIPQVIDHSRSNHWTDRIYVLCCDVFQVAFL